MPFLREGMPEDLWQCLTMSYNPAVSPVNTYALEKLLHMWLEETCKNVYSNIVFNIEKIKYLETILNVHKQ